MSMPLERLSATPSQAVITFADFQPGAVLGHASATLDAGLLAAWSELFPPLDAGGGPPVPTVPPGVLSALIMRAYLEVVTPRPPGNIHAKQRFELVHQPSAGAVVTTEVRCLGKVLREGRRRVHFGCDMMDAAGGLVMVGRSTILWAA